MKQIPSLLEYFLRDCLDNDKSYHIKQMFGGYGIYKDAKIFALYAFEEIYFKTSDKNSQDFIKKWAKIFSYEKKWKIQTIRYYTLPQEIMEDREALHIWIKKSLET